MRQPELTSNVLQIANALTHTCAIPSALAFCVGEFDHVQAQTDHGVLVKVYTPPGKSGSGQFALDCAIKSLDAYDDFFGLPYPLPKLDMIAIPEFAAGAMENFGLVTYREGMLYRFLSLPMITLS